MAIQGIEQPALIHVDESLRLRKYDGVYDFALTWYQDEETVYLVDGKRDPYTMPRLKGMFEFLNNVGELYFKRSIGERYIQAHRRCGLLAGGYAHCDW